MADLECDVLIVGSGLAGLALAMKVSRHRKIIIVSKSSLHNSNTEMAQGGIAAKMSAEDSFAAHIRDTLIAGAGLCRIDAVSNFVEQAPDRIKELAEWGVDFDQKKDESNLGFECDLTREGGHSFRRILHHGDQTGAHIHARLLHTLKKNSQVLFLEKHFAIDMILQKHVEPWHVGASPCIGAYVFNQENQKVLSIKAKSTVLATGGAGKIYLYTTNWSGATGDGIAMAYRAGARVANLEFMQFHPTCLYHREARNFLISEALRGEGGELINAKGEMFMKKYHPSGSLAPRDVVARSIDAEIKKSGESCVFLDMTKLPKDFLQNRFPVIYQTCLNFGIDMSLQPIPVVPAAHYLCGGVLTDINGQTDIPGLFAIGETACTGFHGANRLASNSLLECTGMAHNCSQNILSQNFNLYSGSIPPWIYPQETNADELIVVSHMWEEIRRLMWNYVGIVRSNKRLTRAQSRLKNILTEVRDYYSNFQPCTDILELRNLALVADLSVECALRRHESRGIHYSLDYPFAKFDLDSSPLLGADVLTQSEARNTIIN